MHPLSPKFEDCSDEELLKKVNELHNKINFVARMGNYELVNQMRLILDDINEEVQKRNQQMLERMQKKSGEFKSIIDIQ